MSFLLLPSGYRAITGIRVSAIFRPSGEQYSRSVNRQTWLVFLEHPLIGVGYGNVRSGLGEYATEAGATQVGGEPHNLYLTIAADLGIVGLVLFLLFAWYADLNL